MIVSNTLCVFYICTIREILSGDLGESLGEFLETHPSEKKSFDIYVFVNNFDEKKLVSKLEVFKKSINNKKNCNSLSIINCNIEKDEDLFWYPWVRKRLPDNIPDLGYTSGANLLFYKAMEKMFESKHKYFLMLECDTRPLGNLWFDACEDFCIKNEFNIAGSKYKGQVESHYQSPYKEHLNGVAIYKNSLATKKAILNSKKYIKNNLHNNYGYLNFDIALHLVTKDLDEKHFISLDTDFILNISDPRDFVISSEDILNQYSNGKILHQKKSFSKEPDVNEYNIHYFENNSKFRIPLYFNLNKEIDISCQKNIYRVCDEFYSNDSKMPSDSVFLKLNLMSNNSCTPIFLNLIISQKLVDQYKIKNFLDLNLLIDLGQKIHILFIECNHFLIDKFDNDTPLYLEKIALAFKVGFWPFMFIENPVASAAFKYQEVGCLNKTYPYININSIFYIFSGYFFPKQESYKKTLKILNYINIYEPPLLDFIFSEIGKAFFGVDFFNSCEDVNLKISTNKNIDLFVKDHFHEVSNLYQTSCKKREPLIASLTKNKNTSSQEESVNNSIDTKNGLIYIHIPKCAGNFTKKNIGVFSGDSHCKFLDLSKGDLKDKKVFALVRNPFDRCYSAYKYLINGGSSNNYDLAYAGHLLNNFATFSDFLHHGIRDASTNIIHFFPQIYFLEGGDFDYIGRVESIDRDINIMNNISEYKNTSEIRKTISESLMYDYSNEEKEIVYNVYKTDFEKLKYNFSGDFSEIPNFNF